MSHKVTFAPLMGIARIEEGHRTVEVSVHEPVGTCKTVIENNSKKTSDDPTSFGTRIDDSYPYRVVRKRLVQLHKQHSAVGLILLAFDSKYSLDERERAAKQLKQLENSDETMSYVLRTFSKKPMPESADMREDILKLMPGVIKLAVQLSQEKVNQNVQNKPLIQ